MNNSMVNSTVNHSKRIPKIGFADQSLLNSSLKYCRILQVEHSAILSTSITSAIGKGDKLLMALAQLETHEQKFLQMFNTVQSLYNAILHAYINASIGMD